ncbi:MAG: hypothetical protein N2253_02090 [Bacteroidia bacterium]|nr:hypothetical protein [Bacteroidia bacterium]MCX7763668.1 hypothetical protein [Bacteroidia bacterium]MDW8057779.1 hypothetical protein [Bacteroidia bacterium]
MWRFWLLCSLAVGQGLLVEPLPHGLAVAPFLHSYGWGLGIYVPHWKAARSGTFWMGDLTSYRSKYEGRIRSAYRDQGGKDYVFGKLYYAYLLEVLWGYEYIIAPRTLNSSLQVSLQAGVGPAVTFLKPYYIEIAVPISANQAVIQVDTYNPTRHSYYDIVGEADFYLGFDKLQGVPGVAGQVGAMIDVGKEASLIRSLALGVRVQGFARPIQTLYQRPGRNLWAAGYLAFYIGNAWK